MVEARTRTAKAHRSPIVDPPGLNPPIPLDRPLAFDDPDATPRAQTPNQQELPLRAPHIEMVHEPDRGASVASDEVVEPPPSYAS
ncbi:hypothetical protein BD779DRAFT_1520612 [Infundibulicybe gibba]|nr:hypothetical protein BD779DRAFT_1520612 [Infundibulicybe gibba]